MSEPTGLGEKNISAPAAPSSPLKTVVGVAKPLRKRLTMRQEAFVKAITTPGVSTYLTPSKAYAATHPDAKHAVGISVGASRTLSNVNVQDAVRERLDKMGMSKERLEGELAWGMEETQKVRKYDSHRAYIETLAKLRGDWKEKQEVTTISDQEKDAIRRTVLDAMHTNS